MEELVHSLYNQAFITGKTITWHGGKIMIIMAENGITITKLIYFRPYSHINFLGNIKRILKLKKIGCDFLHFTHLFIFQGKSV